MAQLTFGDHAVDIENLPPVTQVYLMQRTFSHKLGNEVASAVLSKVRTAANNKEATISGFSEMSEANKAQVAQWEKELRNLIVKDLLAGEVTNRGGGPRLDPVEKEMKHLAELKVNAEWFKPRGLKIPQGKDRTIEVTYDGGLVRSYNQMVQNCLANHEAKLRVQAARIIRERDRAADAPKEKPTDAADLGF